MLEEAPAGQQHVLADQQANFVPAFQLEKEREPGNKNHHQRPEKGKRKIVQQREDTFRRERGINQKNLHRAGQAQRQVSQKLRANRRQKQRNFPFGKQTQAEGKRGRFAEEKIGQFLQEQWQQMQGNIRRRPGQIQHGAEHRTIGVAVPDSKVHVLGAGKPELGAQLEGANHGPAGPSHQLVHERVHDQWHEQP